jgi:hypothetical protein
VVGLLQKERGTETSSLLFDVPFPQPSALCKLPSSPCCLELVAGSVESRCGQMVSHVTKISTSCGGETDRRSGKEGGPVNHLLTMARLHLGNQKLTKMTKVLTDARSIRIKGRSFLALVLSPELPLDWWLGRLDDLASRSAGFFLGRPVVLDVADLEIVSLRHLRGARDLADPAALLEARSDRSRRCACAR